MHKCYCTGCFVETTEILWQQLSFCVAKASINRSLNEIADFKKVYHSKEKKLYNIFLKKSMAEIIVQFLVKGLRNHGISESNPLSDVRITRTVKIQG